MSPFFFSDLALVAITLCVCGVLDHDSRCWRMVLQLRTGNVDSVTILCDNEEGVGPDNCAVECFAEWTDYKERRFYGNTLYDALRNACAAKEKAKL